MKSIIQIILFFSFSLIALGCFAQKQKKITKVVVYYYQEDLFPQECYEPDFTNFNPRGTFWHIYKRGIERSFYNDLNSYIQSMDTLKKKQFNFFDPKMFIEYCYENDTTKNYIALDWFGNIRTNNYYPKDTVLNSDKYLIRLLEKKVKGFRKQREKCWGASGPP